MTEPHHDPSLEDLEAVSAHLDGEATAEELARIDGDPSLQALASRMAAARDRLAVDDPPGSVVDTQVTAALDAFDTGPATAPVVELAAVRQRRWYHKVPFGAVAAALVIVALFGALTQIDTGGDDSAETASDSAAEDSGDDAGVDETTLADDGAGGGAAGEGSEADEGTASASAPDVAFTMLEFATVDELATHLTEVVLDQLNTTSSQRTDAPDDPDVTAPADQDVPAAGESGRTCDPVSATGAEGSPLLAVLPAVVDGRAVTAVVVDAVEGESSRRLLVVDDATCAVVDDRPLD